MLPTDEFTRPNRVRYDCDSNYGTKLRVRLNQVYRKVSETREKAKHLGMTQYNINTKWHIYELGKLGYVKVLSSNGKVQKAVHDMDGTLSNNRSYWTSDL